MKKICIIGTTPSRGMAPFDDPEWEVWTIGPGGRDVPGHRWERLYEIHGAGRNHTWSEDFGEYLEFLSKVEPPKRVITIRPISEMIRDWAEQHGKVHTDEECDIWNMFMAKRGWRDVAGARSRAARRARGGSARTRG